MITPAEGVPRGPLLILQVAAEAIAERGLADVDIETIAERAGVDPSVILSYFGSRDRLLTEALVLAEDRFAQEELERIRATGSPRDHLVRLLEATCPRPHQHEELLEWKLWIELWARALRDPEANRKRETLDRRWRSTIASVVREGQETGDFAPVDPEDFALRLAALIDGLATQVALGDPEITCDRMMTLCLQTAERELLPAGERLRSPRSAGS